MLEDETLLRYHKQGNASAEEEGQWSKTGHLRLCQLQHEPSEAANAINSFSTVTNRAEQNRPVACAVLCLLARACLASNACVNYIHIYLSMMGFVWKQCLGAEVLLAYVLLW
jgi:hypothetical protein